MAFNRGGLSWGEFMKLSVIARRYHAEALGEQIERYNKNPAPPEA